VYQPVSLPEYEELARQAELGELRVEPQPDSQSGPRA
jgi:hypothetical protein